MPQVQILRRQLLKRPLDAEEQAPVTEVTYSTAETPPRTVTVPGESPSDEEIAEAIRQDLAERQAEPPSTIEV